MRVESAVVEQDAGRCRLVAVVVTYNRLAQLQVTVARLLETSLDHLHAILVVDNHSGDGTADWLAQISDPRLVVHRSATNQGGAGGFATGMRIAMGRYDPDWLVVMDDDARPHQDALAAFHAMDLSTCDAVAAAVYFPDGTICDMNRPSRNPFWHGREFLQTLRHGRGGFHLDPTRYDADRGTAVDVTSFVGFFISRRGVELGGYPDPALFLYADDGIYALRLRLTGARILFQPTVRFEHDCSTFGNHQRGRFQPLWKVYYYHRNLLMLYRLAAGWWFVPVLMIIVPKWFLKARAHTGERARFLGLMLRAVRDGILRRTDVTHADVMRWSDPPVSRAKR
ncbi:MAG: glycosyltransferase [Pseudomonadota bacterium]